MPYNYLLSILFLVFSLQTFGQRVKSDNSLTGQLKQDITTIAADQMAGRLTGSAEAANAANYIEHRFTELGIPAYKNKYQWEFTAKTGFRLGKDAYFKIFNEKLTIGKEVIFFPFGSGNKLRGQVMPNVNEPDNVWLVPSHVLKLNETNNPQKVIYEYARDAISHGASSVVFFNDVNAIQDMSALNLLSFESVAAPVAFINFSAYQQHILPGMKKDWIDIDARLGIEDASSTGRNVIAMVNNNAPLTIVVGANYDHVGIQGEIYNGADNNASGVAALLALATQVKDKGLNRYNYLFIAFAGREQSYQGSTAFLAQNEHLLNAFSCMINLDKIGRLNSDKKLFISGIGTSTAWLPLLEKNNRTFKLDIDTSGLGYSDHNSFYKKQIPVLHVSTGYHDDYMTPKDDADKINYNGEASVVNFVSALLSDLDNQSKLTFIKTNDVVSRLEKAKLDFGIIPNFTFDENGILVDHCMANKLAQQSGIKAGDVIIKIGPFKIIDFDDYLDAMNKTDKNVETAIVIKRDDMEYKFFVTFQDYSTAPMN
jgi:hypothetical protein